MTTSFRLTSWYSIALLLLTSCTIIPVVPRHYDLPLVNVDTEMQKFNLQICFKKQSFRGMLIVQRRSDCEIRIVASTYFGPTLFDFGLKDGQFAIYSCISPLQRYNVIRLFENDFKKLFLPSQNFRKTKLDEGYEERISGRNFGKSIFQIYNSQGERAKKINIIHPWIGVSINLEEL